MTPTPEPRPAGALRPARPGLDARRPAVPGCVARRLALAAAAAWLAHGAALAAATTPAELLTAYRAQGAAPDAARGQALFTSRHGKEWSCASCHGNPPTTAGRHASTGKTIEPLAPAANAQRFTDAAKVEKWFRRNCNDVLARECTVAEKADVLAWLAGLR